MDSVSLIGQNAFSSALQKQAASNAVGISAADQKKIKKTAQDFEGFFVGQMMETMTEGLETDSYFGGGHGEDMWRSMMNQEYGKEVAKSGRLGIGNTVMTAMLRAQEERTKAQMQTSAPASSESAAPASAETAEAVPTPAAASAQYLGAAVQAGTALTRSLKGI